MKTALVLAGGGSRGAYQMGVWQALREMGIRIDVVTGTSIGSMNAALIAQDSFEEAKHLWLTLDTEEVFDYKHVVENRGVEFTSVKDVMGNVLNEELLRNSPIRLGIVTVKLPKMEAMHCWVEDIPEGKILDYIFASCSCFPVVKPYEIDKERFVDGGFTDNMPIGMALEENPDVIIAVDLDGYGMHREKDVKLAADKLRIIKSSWDLGNFAVFDPKRSAFIMRLGYLDAFKAFGAFSGDKYTFFRGQFNLRNMKAIEKCAECFGLDPQIVYTRDIFMERLKAAINKQYEDAEKAGKAIKAFDPFKLVFKKDAAKKQNTKKDISFKEDIEGIVDFGERAELLGICAFIRSNPDFKTPKTIRKMFRDTIAAANWLLEEELV